jgi:hypothetical protein
MTPNDLPTTNNNSNNKKQKEVILCKKDGCKFKQLNDSGYCGKHTIHSLFDDAILRNMRLCSNYLRKGCRQELSPEYTKSQCETCLAKDRKADRTKRSEAAIKSSEASENNLSEKPCSVCCKILPMSHFEGKRSSSEYTKTCFACRESNKKQNAKRDKEHINELARIADKKPERIAVKKAWKENNYEKVAETWQKSRNNRIKKVGIDEYLNIAANDAQRWRDNNPEKMKQINEDKRNSLHSQFSVYERCARDKRINFELSIDNFETITKNPCYYCGIIQERGFNGIDRMKSNEAYILENCVSCCKMCNHIKNTLSTDVFIKKVEHIVTFQENNPEGKLYPELFTNYNNANFTSYKNSANKRKIHFEICEQYFNIITQVACYICGKISTFGHINGIDRYDNTQGYSQENCKPCCGGCNFMKNKYPYDEWYAKLKQINSHCKQYKPNNDEKNNEQDCVMQTRTNKKTKNKKTEQARIRKQQQRKRMVEKYGDEEYRKIRAKEISEFRKKKREQKEAEDKLNANGVDEKYSDSNTDNNPNIKIDDYTSQSNR